VERPSEPQACRAGKQSASRLHKSEPRSDTRKGGEQVCGDAPWFKLTHSPCTLIDQLNNVRCFPMSQTEKWLMLAGILFFLLLNYPFVQVFNVPGFVFDVPLELFYLSLVWILIIFTLFLFGYWLRSRREPTIKP
jgi:hypothetical protein